ncbi:MAG: disulfide isomerase [Epsilonproteobacteria bacterium]|nr:disulfide isomerase [Campylobacterota bacterium]NPA89705.1 DUF255 domain-containing protein [Campylobacterota bacterium]
MRKLMVMLATALVLFGFDWSGKVNWAMGYQQAKQLAQQQNKLIFVDIGLTHCPPCRYLAQHVYTDEKVADYINKHFIPVFYLADQDRLPPEVANYFTGTTPTILFIKPNGELLTSFIGSRPPAIFLQTLKQVESKFKGSK